jgi:hypothetical protein
MCLLLFVQFFVCTFFGVSFLGSAVRSYFNAKPTATLMPA